MKNTHQSPWFSKYKTQIENEILLTIPRLGPPSQLRDACQYALTVGGKRCRPIITLITAEALNRAAPILPAALAVEFFHTASIVADDLPCMDDDDERRNHPSTHRKYGEAAALLVSYALISAGYDGLVKNTQMLKVASLAHSSLCDRICGVALENATYNTGLFGATGGQFMDIAPPDLSLLSILDIIHKKTVSLFEIAFVFGWAFGGGSLDRLEEVKKLASHYGTAFQIADDLDDALKDKTSGRAVNLANIVGFDAAIELFHKEVNGYNDTLNELNIATEPMLLMGATLREGLKLIDV